MESDQRGKDESVTFESSPVLAQKLAEKPFLTRDDLLELGVDVPFVGFEEEVAAYEAADRSSPPITEGVLFLGNSDIRRWEPEIFRRHFGRFGAVNRGFGGARTWETLIYFGRLVLPWRPRVVVYCAGDNDIAKLGARGVRSAVQGFKLFMGLVNAHLVSTRRVLYLAIHRSPSDRPLWGYIAQADAELKAFCARSPRTLFVDYLHLLENPDGSLRGDAFVADGLHFTAAFYEELSAFLEPIVDCAMS